MKCTFGELVLTHDGGELFVELGGSIMSSRSPTALFQVAEFLLGVGRRMKARRHAAWNDAFGPGDPLDTPLK